MKQVGNLVLMTASALAGAGAAVGVVGAAVGLLLGRGLEGIAQVVADSYWALIVVLPAVLWLAHLIAADSADGRAVFASWRGTLLASLLGAGAGAVLAGGPTFLVGGINVPIVLGGLEATAFSQAVRDRIYWDLFLLVSLVTVLSALPVSWWARTRRKRWA